MTGGRAVRLGLGLWASAVFAILWVGAAASLVTGDGLASDAWAALTALAPPLQVAAWVLLLPVAVALWASQAGLAAPAALAVLVALVLWTIAAWASLARTLRDRGVGAG